MTAGDAWRGGVVLRLPEMDLLTHAPPQPSAAATQVLCRSRSRDLILVTAERFLKVRYRGSVLGVYWSLSNPLLMTGAYTLIFGSAFKSYYNGSLWEYVLSCFTGLAFLNFFSGGTSMALPSIVASGPLQNKIALPPSIFPVATIAANTFQLLMGVVPLLAIVTFCTSLSLLNVVALAVPVAALVALSLGFALAVSSLFVYFRDLPYLYELITFVLWLTSPIFYPAALVPAAVRGYLVFNPLSAIIECARQIALSGQRPSLKLMAIALTAGALGLAIGWGLYRRLRHDFMDLL
jgi:ABC-type polysaccharide/polyol phosphate export permease